MSAIKNLDKAVSRLDKIGKGIQKTAVTALGQEAEEIIDASQPLVPVDTGALKASYYVNETQAGVKAGYSADYAMKVHEDLNMDHRIGEAKFLEKPYLARKPQIRTKVETKVKDLIKSS